MTPRPDDIAAAMRAVVARVLAEDAGHPLEINDGLCEEVASEVLERLGVEDGDGVETFWCGNLTDEDDAIDRRLMRRLFPASVPPPGLRWSDLDRLGFGDMAHAWLAADGRHYDADAPEGVDSLFDLPIFRRNLCAGIRECRPRDEARLSDAHPWWRESFAMHDGLLEWRRSRRSRMPAASGDGWLETLARIADGSETDPDALERLVDEEDAPNAFLHGRCHLMALALHEATALPVGAVFDGDGNGRAWLLHAFVVDGDDVIDVRGRRPFAAMMADFEPEDPDAGDGGHVLIGPDEAMRWGEGRGADDAARDAELASARRAAPLLAAIAVRSLRPPAP